MKNQVYKMFNKVSASDWYDMPMETESTEPPMTEVQVFPIGTFDTHHQVAEGFQIDESLLRTVIDNFHAKIRPAVPVYSDHDQEDARERPARGWVKDFILKTDGLYALVAWTWKGYDLIREKEYMFVSPEWFTDYVRPATGEGADGWLVSAISLVNEPYFPNAPIVAGEKTKNNDIIILEAKEQKITMDLQALLQKAVDELSAEEKAFVVEHESELTDEQKTTFAVLFEKKEEESTEEKEDNSKEKKEDEEKSDEESKEKESTEDEPSEPNDAGKGTDESSDEEVEDKESGSEGDSDEDDSEDESKDEESEKGADDEAGESDEDVEDEAEQEEGEKLEASEKLVKVTAGELARLRASEQKLVAAEVGKRIDKIITIPAARTIASEFALKLKASERDAFYSVLEQATKHVATERKSVADTSTDEGGVEEQVRKLAYEKLESNSKLSFRGAMDEVLAEKPALKEALNASGVK